MAWRDAGTEFVSLNLLDDRDERPAPPNAFSMLFDRMRAAFMTTSDGGSTTHASHRTPWSENANAVPTSTFSSLDRPHEKRAQSPSSSAPRKLSTTSTTSSSHDATFSRKTSVLNDARTKSGRTILDKKEDAKHGNSIMPLRTVAPPRTVPISHATSSASSSPTSTPMTSQSDKSVELSPETELELSSPAQHIPGFPLGHDALDDTRSILSATPNRSEIGDDTMSSLTIRPNYPSADAWIRRFRGEGLSRKYWMADKTAKECRDCLLPFTPLRRRHHCRICGQIFCYKCCSEIVPGDRFGHADTRMLEEYDRRETIDAEHRAAWNGRTDDLASLPPPSPTQSEEYEIHTPQSQFAATTLFSRDAHALPWHTNPHRDLRDWDEMQSSDFDESGDVSHTLGEITPFRAGLDAEDIPPIPLVDTPFQKDHLPIPAQQESCASEKDADARMIPIQPPDSPVRRTARQKLMRGASRFVTSTALSAPSLVYFLRMLHQVLVAEHIPGVQEWKETIKLLALSVIERIRMRPRDSYLTDIRNFVKIKCLPGARISDCDFLDGYICTKNVATKRMASFLPIRHARIMVIAFPLEYHRNANQLMSLEPILAQEHEFLRILVARILALRPNVVIAEKSVSYYALRLFEEAHVAVFWPMKRSSIEILARCTQADIVSSIDRLALEPRLGRCACLSVDRYEFVHEPGRCKPLLRIEVMSKDVSSALVLRGASIETLRRIKSILALMVFIGHNLKLEEYLRRDTGISLDWSVMNIQHGPEDALASVSADSLQDATRNQMLTDTLRKYHRLIFSASISVIFPPPFLVTHMKQITERLHTLRNNASKDMNQRLVYSVSKVDGYVSLQQIHSDHDDSHAQCHQHKSQPLDLHGGMDHASFLQSAAQDAKGAKDAKSFSRSSPIAITDMPPKLPRQSSSPSMGEAVAQSLSGSISSTKHSGESQSASKTLDIVRPPSCPPPEQSQLSKEAGDLSTLPHSDPTPEHTLSIDALSSMQNSIVPAIETGSAVKSGENDRHVAKSATFPSSNIPESATELGEKPAQRLEATASDSNLAALRESSKDSVETLNLQDPASFQDMTERSLLEAEQAMIQRSWKSCLSNMTGMLTPFAHQRLVALVSTTCTVTNQTCQGPSLRTTEYYSVDDEPLGRMLERVVEQSADFCTMKGCDRANLLHYTTFQHNEMRVQMMIERFACPLAGEEKQLLCWSYCKACSRATPVAHLSDETWSLSFAKYLELQFYPNTACHPSTCQHDYYRDSVRYFALGNLAIRFHADPIVPWSVIVPPMYRVTLENRLWALKNEETLRLVERNFQYWDSICMRVAALQHELKTAPVYFEVASLAEMQSNALNTLQAIQSAAQAERASVQQMIMQEYWDSDRDLLRMNEVRRRLQDKVVLWDGLFMEFEKRCTVSARDIRKLLAHKERRQETPAFDASQDRRTSSLDTPASDNHRRSLDMANVSLWDVFGSRDDSEKPAPLDEPKNTNPVSPPTSRSLSASFHPTDPEKRDSAHEANLMLPTDHSARKDPIFQTDGDQQVFSTSLESITTPSIDTHTNSKSSTGDHLDETISSSTKDPQHDPSARVEDGVILPSGNDPRGNELPINQSPVSEPQRNESSVSEPPVNQSTDGETPVHNRPDDDPPVTQRLASCESHSTSLAAPQPIRPIARQHPDLLTKNALDNATTIPPKGKSSKESKRFSSSNNKQTTFNHSEAHAMQAPQKRQTPTPFVHRLRPPDSSTASFVHHRADHILNRVPWEVAPQRRPKRLQEEKRMSRSQVSSMTRHFDLLSREAEQQREQQREQRRDQVRRSSSRTRRARPVTATHATVEVFTNLRDAVHGDDDDEHENEDGQEAGSDGERHTHPTQINARHEHHQTQQSIASPNERPERNLDHKPSSLTESSLCAEADALAGSAEEPASRSDTVLKSDDMLCTLPSDVSPVQYDPRTLFKQLEEAWTIHCGELPALAYPFPSTDHVFSDSSVVVREDEPSSIIAFTLHSKAYCEQLHAAQQARARTEGAVPPATQESSTEQLRDLEAELRTSEGTHLGYEFDTHSIKMWCKIFFAEQFDALRHMYGCNDSIVQSLSRCYKWDSGGGKSGSAFLKTRDDRLIVKQLSRAEMDGFSKFAPQYFAYIADCKAANRPTTLSKIFGYFRIGFRNPQTGRNVKLDVVVMENLVYGHQVLKIFDLKGSTRNRLRQETNREFEVLLDENLVHMSRTEPILVREYSKRILRAALYNDSLFLSDMNVMDYSLIVVLDKTRNELVIGIIDYLRTYTWDKRVESFVKETAILGGGGKGEPTIITPRQYRMRFLNFLDRYFLLTPDPWLPPGWIV
ncbi:1-phosphatidylinositol-3-phosphate 5-kinase [Malassezia yamatoensis]|uniref:1-phosphatidylinositol-3-phosphate 5-kinase n=1 Tax=Malassezia yamatoensis TaxID=253288 RepID=A0AAJ5YTF5_9BASI|nr:1-phosphatidylinositol-3-phosphate 5-kinase [Malassezia yamatoensis]